jgi:flagellar protein FlaG
LTTDKCGLKVIEENPGSHDSWTLRHKDTKKGYKVFRKNADKYSERRKKRKITMDMAISNINAGYNLPQIAMPGSASNIPDKQESSAKAPVESAALSSDAVKQLLAQIQGQLESMNISLSFSRYGKNGDSISVVVTEKNTGKVIREIPPKELQNLYTKLGELIGLIFNHSA